MMGLYSPQPWFCNCCGRDMSHASPCSAMGRDFRVCSVECVREMRWRHTLSIMGKPYRLDPETPLGRRVDEMEQAERAGAATPTVPSPKTGEGR